MPFDWTIVDPMLHDIVVHFNGSMSHILNVNPYKYNYMQLLADASEATLTNVPGNFGVGLNLYFTNTHTKSKMEVKSDQDVIEMFSSNSGTTVINIFLELNQLLPSFVVTDTPTLVERDTKVDANEENAYIISDEDDEDDEDTSDNDEGSNGSDEPIEANDEWISNYESDDIGGKYSTDEEDVQGVNIDIYMRGKMFEIKEGEKITLEKGMIFDDVNHFRTVLQEFAIERGFKLIKIKNDKKRVTCICASSMCEWRIHASPLSDGVTYKIKTLGTDHTCIRVERNTEAAASWIATKFEKTLRGNPGITLEAMHDEIAANYGLETTSMQLYGGIEGNHAKAYTKLPMYAAQVLRTNPGTILGGGISLAAVGLDGNNGLHRIAIAVVESECKDSWAFFLYHLNTIFGNGPQNMPLTIMSDGQKGIESAMRQVIPQATHRRCCRHIFSNLKGKFPGLKIKRAFWAAAKAYNVKDFNIAMGQMLELSSEAHSWLSKFPVEIWARHTFDHRVKSEHVTSNMVEPFNNWIGQEKYQVVEGVVSYIVNLQRRSCCCRIWDINGVPCKHATACITHKRMNLETYCNTMYYKHIYFKAYGEIIHPIHDESLWGPVLGDELKPPPLKRMPGRPRKSRRREIDEAAPSKRSCTVRCIICKEIGHNKRTCQRAPIRDREMGTNESAQRGIGTIVKRSTIGRSTATERSTGGVSVHDK
ncbi:uncharacterized protein LOC114301971 [Camellia sinensis]|uniref:uncharacterized protein LOC114301971 n=1 Tax=Camellia sinensis TaxID=4442 RepID=UPI00103694FA|nr:uncharacterized protein LOC114301971 [Camellia sinensis]